MYLQNISKENKMFYPGNHHNLNDILRNIIAEDSDGIFQATSIDRENHPEVNFRTIAIGWLDGQSWQHMAANFGINRYRLRTFYRDCLRRFGDDLRRHLES